MKRKPTRNLLTGKTADVAVSRGGLTVTIESVAAADAAKVAKSILDAFRGLVLAGYDELREVGPSLHGGGVEVAEDADIDPVTLPPEGKAPRAIGF